ncbi:hypothetical protein MED222_05430 [Vibrio sp. MED222]|nr:hypothetical protein MED222_05430 [Vibrio sp. MED222]
MAITQWNKAIFFTFTTMNVQSFRRTINVFHVQAYDLTDT